MSFLSSAVSFRSLASSFLLSLSNCLYKTYFICEVRNRGKRVSSWKVCFVKSTWRKKMRKVCNFTISAGTSKSELLRALRLKVFDKIHKTFFFRAERFPIFCSILWFLWHIVPLVPIQWTVVELKVPPGFVSRIIHMRELFLLNWHFWKALKSLKKLIS